MTGGEARRDVRGPFHVRGEPSPSGRLYWAMWLLLLSLLAGPITRVSFSSVRLIRAFRPGEMFGTAPRQLLEPVCPASSGARPAPPLPRCCAFLQTRRLAATVPAARRPGPGDDDGCETRQTRRWETLRAFEPPRQRCRQTNGVHLRHGRYWQGWISPTGPPYGGAVSGSDE